MTLAHDELTGYLSDHILASLVTAAIGDAMGAASEQHTIGEVVARYGGLLKEFHAPSTETFSHGNLAGQITDDCSQMFLLAQLLIDYDGIFPEASWIAALVEWSQTSPHRNQMGPTSRPLLEAIANGQDTTMIGCNPISKRRLTTFGATNGAAMRIAPVGLIWPGNIERAVELAWQTCRPTHNTQIAAAGACSSQPALQTLSNPMPEYGQSFEHAWMAPEWEKSSVYAKEEMYQDLTSPEELNWP